MKKVALFSTASAALLALCPLPSAHAAQLLLNGNFETDVQASNGDHHPVPVTDWTIAGGDANLTRGPVTKGNVSATSGASNLPIDPNDSTGLQSLDITVAGTASQTFKAQFNQPVTIKFDIGDRDATESGGAAPVGSTWTLLNGTTVVASSPVTLNPGFNLWATNTSTTTVSLIAGTMYTFQINLDNPDQVDGLSIIQVPEPSTLAAVGIGTSLLGWVGFKRRRQG